MPRIVSLLFHDVYVNDVAESGFCSPAANRYKLTNAEFDAQLQGLVGIGLRAAPPAQLLAGPGRSAAHAESRDGSADAGHFIVTVDDGGVSYYTVIADQLEKRGWCGACFVSTNFIGRPGFLDSRQLRDLDERGHLIGSHSASHPTRFSACSAAEMHDEWTRSRTALEDILGHEVTTASLPGGYFSQAVARTASDAGFSLLFTSEPDAAVHLTNECRVAGRFTIRAGARPDLACALVAPAPWTRLGAWASWNAKGLIKPLLGSSYPLVADLIRGR